MTLQEFCAELTKVSDLFWWGAVGGGYIRTMDLFGLQEPQCPITALANEKSAYQPQCRLDALRAAGEKLSGKAPALAKGAAGRIACRSYRENVSMIASAIPSAYSSSAKWLASK